MSREERKDILEEETEARIEPNPETTKEHTPPKGGMPPRDAILQRGALTLATPIESEGEEVTELAYDFAKLTGKDLVQILDSRVPSEIGNGEDGLNARKARLLFAKAAAGQKNLDAYDIEDRLGLTDSLAAIRLGKTFFADISVRGLRNMKTL